MSDKKESYSGEWIYKLRAILIAVNQTGLVRATEEGQNAHIRQIYEIIKELIEPNYRNRKKIGF